MTRKEYETLKERFNEVTKEDVKFEVMRDYDGDVRGYRLGTHYLFKHYGSLTNNSYSWFITDEDNYHYYDCEFSKKYDDGSIILVDSCKEGKEKLKELYFKGV